MHSSCRLDERARPEIVRNILGHVDIRVTQNVNSKSWWKGFPDEPATRAHGHESARKSLRSRSPWPSRRSPSTAACVFLQIGTARAHAFRPLAVSIIRRPRRSAGSAMIRTSPRRRKGLRAAVNVVRSIASSDATAVIPGGSGRFREVSSENCPLVSPIGRSASSKRRASALAARWTCKQRQQSRTMWVIFKDGCAAAAISK